MTRNKVKSLKFLCSRHLQFGCAVKWISKRLTVLVSSRCDLDTRCFAILFNKSSGDCLILHNLTPNNQTKFFSGGHSVIAMKHKS